MICIKNFPNRIEAELAKNMLEINGLTAIILTDDCGGMRPHFQLDIGVRLMVKEEDAQKAQEILEEITAQNDVSQ